MTAARVGDVVTVLSRTPDPQTLKFSVLVAGWREDWTLEEIKAAVYAPGVTVKEYTGR